MTSLLSVIERVPVGSLVLHPRNARRGNVAVIAASLSENAQYAPLVVQRSTRHVLAGNHTLRAVRDLGWSEVDVVFVDVDDERAVRIMLSSNRTADLADYDERLLLELLESLDEDLSGTGYDPGDVADLLAGLGDGDVGEVPASGADVADSGRVLTCPQCGHQWAS